jgi:hypothetical protein
MGHGLAGRESMFLLKFFVCGVLGVCRSVGLRIVLFFCLEGWGLTHLCVCCLLLCPCGVVLFCVSVASSHLLSSSVLLPSPERIFWWSCSTSCSVSGIMLSEWYDWQRWSSCASLSACCLCFSAWQFCLVLDGRVLWEPRVRPAGLLLCLHPEELDSDSLARLVAILGVLVAALLSFCVLVEVELADRLALVSSGPGVAPKFAVAVVAAEVLAAFLTVAADAAFAAAEVLVASLIAAAAAASVE